jgi:hypothetical protein
VDFTVNIQLAQSPRDQLSDLAAKIDDQKALEGGMCHGPRTSQAGAVVQAGECRFAPLSAAFDDGLQARGT